jgi:hypothetical protein
VSEGGSCLNSSLCNLKRFFFTGPYRYGGALEYKTQIHPPQNVHLSYFSQNSRSHRTFPYSNNIRRTTSQCERSWLCASPPPASPAPMRRVSGLFDSKTPSQVQSIDQVHFRPRCENQQNRCLAPAARLATVLGHSMVCTSAGYLCDSHICGPFAPVREASQTAYVCM